MLFIVVLADMTSRRPA